MSLPIHKLFEIVFLSKHKYGPNFGVKKIASIVKCSTRTVKKWIKRWENDKSLSNKVKSGRPRSTPKAQGDVMEDVANIADEVVTSDINDALQKSNINISQ